MNLILGSEAEHITRKGGLQAVQRGLIIRWRRHLQLEKGVKPVSTTALDYPPFDM